jgi:hypothetical protein
MQGWLALLIHAVSTVHTSQCTNESMLHTVTFATVLPLCQQVFISYGPKSNADLLLLYGFSLDRNPFNSVEVSVALASEDPLFPQKRAFLDGAGRPATMSFPLYNDRYAAALCILTHSVLVLVVLT